MDAGIQQINLKRSRRHNVSGWHVVKVRCVTHPIWTHRDHNTQPATHNTSATTLFQKLLSQHVFPFTVFNVISNVAMFQCYEAHVYEQASSCAASS
jgi:hypothetical protein